MIDLTPSAAQGRYLLSIAASLVTNLDDSHRALEPAAGVKTAGWLLGHLAVTGDFGRRLCGRETFCPREWRAAFNPGTHPSRDAKDYPAMSAIREALLTVYRDFCDTAPAANSRLLSVPNPYTPSQADFPTAGDFVAYLLTGHFAYHLGQLRIWRAASGVAPSVVKPQGQIA